MSKQTSSTNYYKLHLKYLEHKAPEKVTYNQIAEKI
jgi:hypothetical protein